MKESVDKQAQNTTAIEIDQLIALAQTASESFRGYTTEQVTQIVHHVAQVGKEKAAFYAEWLVQETGYGNIKDNITKHLACSVELLPRYHPADFIEPSVDSAKKLICYPKPVGVIAALAPSTNPVMTIYYKVMITMMTRNAVIFPLTPWAGIVPFMPLIPYARQLNRRVRRRVQSKPSASPVASVQII